MNETAASNNLLAWREDKSRLFGINTSPFPRPKQGCCGRGRWGGWDGAILLWAEQPWAPKSALTAPSHLHTCQQLRSVLPCIFMVPRQGGCTPMGAPCLVFRHPETPLWDRGNLFPNSAPWLQGSDLPFSAVKQWDVNRDKQQRSSALVSLAGLGAVPGVPWPGGEADGAPHVQALLPTAAVFPWDGFPMTFLSLPPSPKTHQLLPTAAGPWPRLSAEPRA